MYAIPVSYFLDDKNKNVIAVLLAFILQSKLNCLVSSDLLAHLITETSKNKIHHMFIRLLHIFTMTFIHIPKFVIL